VERFIQSVLQRVLGFDRYLFWFSRFKIRTLHRDRNEGDLFRFLSMLSKDAFVLDIGANLGIMTVLISRAVPRGHVHAFEPIPENFRALSKICSHYRLENVTLHQMALGDEEGELQMVMPEQSNVRMQGLSHAVSAGEGDVRGELYTVPVRRLDDLELFDGRRVDAIKIDVENFELFVFRGGREFLAAHRPLVYSEFWDNDLRLECFELFEGLGYSINLLEDGHLRVVDPEVDRSGNFFLLPGD
jgi:FkbM family methyltransferase